MWWKINQRIILSVLAIVCAAPGAYAFNLPTANEVQPGKRMKIDGEYRISTLNKRVLIERGRAIVLEGWKHMFFWDVKPGMVVIRDIKHRGDGRFTGHDLPLDGPWRAQYNRATGALSVVVKGPTGDYRYKLIPVDATAEDEEYIEPEPVIMRVKANRQGDAVLSIPKTCPGKQSYLSNGACWVCPNDYKRAKLTREMDHPKACVKRKSWGKGPFKKAKRQKVAGARCPSGQFHVAEKGVNGCYTCPTGYVRDLSTRNSAMCQTTQG